MKKFLLYVVLSINIFALDFYLGGGLALDENDSNIPRVFIWEAEAIKPFRFVDIGLGLAYEGNYSPPPMPKDFNYNSFDAIPYYGLIRVKLPLKKYQPFLSLKVSPFVHVLNRGKDYWFIHQAFSASYSRAGIGFIKKDTMVELSTGGIMHWSDNNQEPIDPNYTDDLSLSTSLTIKKRY